MEAQLIEKQAVNATFKVTVPAAEVDATFDQVLGTLSRQVRVPGFRPGRAPRGVLARRVGREALQGEVQEALVDANYPQAVKQLELSPIHAHFHAESPTEGEDFTFEVHAELYPDVVLPDLDDIVIDAEGRTLSDEMVRDAVEQLRRENATLVPVERPVEATDYVLLEDASAEASPEGGAPAATEPTATEPTATEPEATEPEEAGPEATGPEDPEADQTGPDGPEAAGAEPVGAAAAGAPEVSTTPVDMETASEEVREQLFGKAMGELVTLTLTDDAEQDEGGAPAVRTLRVRIRDVKGKEKPDPDDDFARTLGVETWADVEQRVRSSLEDELRREAFESQRDEFVEKLVLGATFEVPQSLLQRRRQSLLEDLQQDLRRQQMTLDRYLELLDERGTRQEFESELDSSARRAVERDIVLERLLEVRGTDVSDEEFDAAIRHLAARRRQDASRFKRDMGDAWVRNYRFLLARDKALREAVEERTGGAGQPAAAPDRGASTPPADAAAEAVPPAGEEAEPSGEPDAD